MVYSFNGILFTQTNGILMLATYHRLTLKTLTEEDTHKNPYIIWFHLYEMSRVDKSIETEDGLVVAGGFGEEGWRITA